MNKVVVFDFDKTLTIKDTNLGFFIFSGKQQRLFKIKLLFYFGLLLIRKLRFISNTRLKNLGFYLFLKSKNEKDVLLLSENYSKSIKLNQPLKELLLFHKKDNDRVVITTASLSSYVNPIFPDIEVVGSELDFTRKQRKLKIHCYSQKKVELLNSIGINKIDVLYTDSISDLPMVMIAVTTNLVKGSQTIKCNSVKDFISALE